MSRQDRDGPGFQLSVAAQAPDTAEDSNARLPVKAETSLTIPRQGGLSRARYADFLPELEAVAEREHSPLARILIIVIAALFAAIVLWAALAQVDQVASAPGQVRPAGKVKIVNHSEGGTVAAIFVKDGDTVVEDQVVLELAPDLVREELAKAEGEWQALSAEAARLTAEAAETAAIAFPPDIAAARPDLVLAQARLFEARRMALETRQAAAQEIVIQRERDGVGIETQIVSLRVGLEVLIEQEQAIGTLADKGYFPKLRYLSVKRQVAEAEGQLGLTLQQLAASESALAEAIDRRDGVARDAKAEVLESLAVTRLNRDQTYRTLLQQRARLENLVLHAPADGIVQNLTVTSVGQAVRPGDTIMNVVPTGETLIIEAQVSNADIGFIHLGQAATVKIVTYDFIKYGSLEGEVERVSASSVENPETGEQMFPVDIRVDRTYLGEAPGQLPVHPGMSAEVDLKIGERSILSFLTDRIARTTSKAFTER